MADASRVVERVGELDELEGPGVITSPVAAVEVVGEKVGEEFAVFDAEPEVVVFGDEVVLPGDTDVVVRDEGDGGGVFDCSGITPNTGIDGWSSATRRGSSEELSSSENDPLTANIPTLLCHTSRLSLIICNERVSSHPSMTYVGRTGKTRFVLV